MQAMRVKVENLSTFSLTKKISRAETIISKEAQWVLYRVLLIISDIFMTGTAFLLAYLVRLTNPLNIFDNTALISYENYRSLVFVLLPLWLLIFAINGLYSKQNLLGGTREYASVFRSATVGFLLVIIIGFLQPGLVIARGWLLMTWVLSFLFPATSRFVLRRGVYRLRRLGFFLTPAIIVGANEEGRILAEQLLNWGTSGLHIIGFVDQKVPVTTPLFHNLISLGTVEQLDQIIDTYNVGEVILASSAFSTRDHLLDIFKKYGVSDHINIHMSSGLYEVITTGLTVNEIAYVPLVYVNKVRLSGIDNLLKLLLDYLITIPGLILISPILLLIAFLVKLSSPGPVIHKRQVMGLNGKQFNALKFRTMVTSGDEVLENYPELKAELRKNYKLKFDPRVTRIGAFLRRYSLDELPQLYNVLMRDMSLVGPRMISPEEVAMYKQFDINLLTVLPGITGLWQVSGRSNISYDERVRLDMYYVRNWSIWLDLQLLFQTIPAVLKGRGAY
jgi:exopolysaccharide biosynthesis polyprenyl glycosylphosphotransferase